MKGRKKRRLNGTVAFQVLLLFGFASFYMYAVLSGTVNRYVHPRIIPYLIFAAGTMAVIAVLLLGNLFKLREKKSSSLPLILFALPLIMAFAVPPQSFNSSTGTIGEVQISGEATLAQDNAKTAQTGQSQDPAGTDGPAAEPGNAADGASAGNGLIQNGVLVMNSANFYEGLNELYDKMDQYQAMPIEVVGFVWKDNDSFTKNEFVPARLMMVCCAADMEPVGPLCQYDKTSELQADSWVKVRGTIGKAEFDGKTVPCIVAQNVEPVQEPDEAYVYPY